MISSIFALIRVIPAVYGIFKKLCELERLANEAEAAKRLVEKDAAVDSSIDGIVAGGVRVKPVSRTP